MLIIRRNVHLFRDRSIWIQLVRLKCSIFTTLEKEGFPLISVKSPIILFDEYESIAVSTGNIEIIGLDFDYLDEKVNFSIAFTDTNAKLSDIVPLARSLCNELVTKLINKLRQDGNSVSCCKGCSACCSYMIPFSVPEVFRLNQEISTMPPENRCRIQKTLLDTAGKILKEKPENLDTGETTQNKSQIQLSQLNKWYASLKIQCPFLSDNLCEIYHQRPLACREHIVTSTPSFCKIKSNNAPDVVAPP